MKADNIDISIIMVNYKTLNFLCNAIDSIIEKTRGVIYEIIVVDNNSNENIKDTLKKRYEDKIIYISLPENIGFGRANNKGIEIAKGRNIFLLNPDTILLNNAIKILNDYLDSDKKTGVCGGNLFNEKMEPTLSFSVFLPSLIWEIDIFFRGVISKLLHGKSIKFNFTDKPKRVAYIAGADMMIKKTVLDKTGIFDPDFFMYYEETELTYRIKKAGYNIVNVPAAQIQHLEGKSFSTNEEKLKYSLEGRNLYYKKTQNKFKQLIINGIFLMTCLSRIVFFKLAGNNQKLKYWQIVYSNIL